ncbi:MAG: cupin domain-containing protein [Acidimicrobiales bacterium]
MNASGSAPSDLGVRASKTKPRRDKAGASPKGGDEKEEAPSLSVDEPNDAGTLGRRLRARRESLGVSLRQFSRDLNVSASFISQLETGKTQPSVATLYAICSALNMSIDDVFDEEIESNDDVDADTPEIVPGDNGRSTATPGRVRTGATRRSPVVSPSQRRRIMLDSGVTWERLSSATNADFDFVFVRYDVGGSSNTDGRLIRHVGTECGYVLRGVLELTLGFETFQMVAGDAISFDSSTPHRLANVGDEPVEAIWFDEGGHNRKS